jgi:hypothetical protein
MDGTYTYQQTVNALHRLRSKHLAHVARWHGSRPGEGSASLWYPERTALASPTTRADPGGRTP